MKRFDGGKPGNGAAAGDEESAPGVRLDDAACDEAIVCIDDRERTGADEFRELADRGQARTRRKLAVLDELGDALGDLVDERDGGIAGQLEH